MSDDPFESKEWLEYADHAMNELVPKLQDSAITISLVPRGDTDIKYALELGMSIMLDKPIIAVVFPGARVPAKLVAVADQIVEGDIHDPSFQDRLHDAINEALERVKKD